ncbi:hypothetical protein DFP72DRAFT_889748 [Ephemerocybe angulata]|uniref:F-box domain-containing protein n=1 Tax=Ephemerocybe angulata TaxID=980116 RepID=A0A8H6I515_9AGAR|nr:hypothetical protein DFP72DRAFT_889748 [Tulosesus angulatus]
MHPVATSSNLSQNNASRFHSNPDILGEICEYLSPNDDLELEPEDSLIASRQNLAWLALTCRAFLEPALDRLWRSLDTLYPLFKILPAFVRTDGTHVLRGSITPEEWERFDWYARRVKKFCYTRDPDNLDIAMHVYFRIAQLRSTPLLSALRHLYCPDISQTDFLISGVCLFLSPSLQTLEFYKITSVEDKLTGTFLHTLWNDGTQLETVGFRGTGLSPGTLDLILNFHTLRQLELTGMGPAIELDWLKRLGEMPKLRDLALDFTNSRIESIEEDLGYRNLKSLMITASLAFTRSFIPHISTSGLEVIVAASSSDTQAERVAFIRDVIERWGATLRDFSLVHINSESAEEIHMVTIAPLIPLKQLTGFRLEGYSIDLTDDNLRIFGSAWPNLTKLLLPYVAGSDRVRPTIESLKILAALCPDLKHLRLPLDTTELPAFVPPPTPYIPPLPVPESPAMVIDDTAEGAPPPLQPLSIVRKRQPHGLQKLTIATSDDTWESKDQLHLARFIDYLFPRLQYVSPFEGHDLDRWTHIHDIVQAFQTVRRETLIHQRTQYGS